MPRFIVFTRKFSWNENYSYLCNMKQTIGFDAKRIVSNTTGLGSYGRTLVNDLIRRADNDVDFLLYAPNEGRDDMRQQIQLDQRSRFVYPYNLGFRFPVSGFTSYWRTHGIVSDLQRDGVQLYHGLSGELPIGLRNAGIRGVVTIHDLIFLRHPEYYPWIDAKLYAWKFHRTLQEADRIIAISQRTKVDIMEFGDVTPERISVVYQSYNPRFSLTSTADALAAVRQRYQLPERFILNVGTIERRKNLRLAVEALSLLPPDIHLVAVGRPTKYAKTLPQNPRFHILSGVPDADLAAIYNLAEVFVYPSRYEGFGIPIIEAIAAGLPVVACTGSCLEEAGGPANLYVNPDDVGGFAEAIRCMLRDAAGRTVRIQKSQQYIQRFRGLDVASQVLDIYRSLL